MLKRIAVLMAAGAVLASAALAAPQAKPAKAAKVKDAKLICPVMGAPITSKAKAFSNIVYKGTRYFMCCGGCPDQFNASPAKFVKAYNELAKKAKKTSSTPTTTTLTQVMSCPISGEAVKGSTGETTTVAGYEVHFCCAGCKPQFDALSTAEKTNKVLALVKK